MAEVYYASMRAREGKGMLEKVERLFLRAGFAALIGKNDLVALKLHFGERGNTAYIRPPFVRRVVDRVRRAGGKPFLTDANTMYRGSRANAVDHLQTAVENGFAYAVVGAPLVIADGLTGKEQVEVVVNLSHFRTVRLGAAVVHADALLALSHFKGHEMTGFGGALKNLGMGCASRAGKRQMHSEVRPAVQAERCEGCARCRRWCPAGAIVVEGRCRIDLDLCIGCGECMVTCPNKAIEVGEPSGTVDLQEKIVEYAYGVLQDKRDKAGFINFVLDVTPDCDCPGWSDAPVVPNVGILASRDPVALDQACYDLVNRSPGLPGTRLPDPQAPDKFLAMHGVDGTIQLAYAEKLGLGSRTYKLVEI